MSLPSNQDADPVSQQQQQLQQQEEPTTATSSSSNSSSDYNIGDDKDDTKILAAFAIALLSSEDLMAWASTEIKPVDLEHLAADLMDLALSSKQFLSLVYLLLQIEFDKICPKSTAGGTAPIANRSNSSSSSSVVDAGPASVVLRGNGLCVRVLDCFTRTCMKPFLQDRLGPTLKSLIASGEVPSSPAAESDNDPAVAASSSSSLSAAAASTCISFEMDPSRIKPPQMPEIAVVENERHLRFWTQKIFDEMMHPETLASMPRLCKCVAGLIRELAMEYEVDPVPLIGGYIMLRIVNPAILFPEKYEMVAEPVSSEMRRNLIFVAKVLQNMSNGVSFGHKEPFMASMNSFIEQNFDRLRGFLLGFGSNTTVDALLKDDDIAASSNFCYPNKIRRDTVRGILRILLRYRADLRFKDDLAAVFESAGRVVGLSTPLEAALASDVESQSTMGCSDNEQGDAAAGISASASACAPCYGGNSVNDEYTKFLRQSMYLDLSDIASLKVLRLVGFELEDSSQSSTAGAALTPAMTITSTMTTMTTLPTSAVGAGADYSVTLSGKRPPQLKKRPVIAVYAENLPAKTIDLNRVLLYFIKEMDRVVEDDYTLVYFHSNFHSQNKPEFGWLRQVYRIFNRKYRKNLKKLVIVHPSFWVKLVFRFLSTIVSSKFARKLHYAERLRDLQTLVPLMNGAAFPTAPSICECDRVYFDKEYRESLLMGATAVSAASPHRRPVDAGQDSHLLSSELQQQQQQHQQQQQQQLQEEEHAGDDRRTLPLQLFRKCFRYLHHRGLAVEGIFRISASFKDIQQLRLLFDCGYDVDLEAVGDPHVVAGLLKMALRDMPDCLTTSALYDRLTVAAPASGGSTAMMRDIVRTEMAPKSAAVLKQLVELLWRVQTHSAMNRMTSNNLAIVFGPSVVRCEGHSPIQQLQDAGLVISVMETLISHYEEIFGDGAAGGEASSATSSSSRLSVVSGGAYDGGRASTSVGGGKDIENLAQLQAMIAKADELQLQQQQEQQPQPVAAAAPAAEPQRRGGARRGNGSGNMGAGTESVRLDASAQGSMNIAFLQQMIEDKDFREDEFV